MRKLGPILLVIIGTLAIGAASAGPLSFYTDQAAWLAAVSGYRIGPYPYDVTRTDQHVTVQCPPSVFCKILNQFTTVTLQSFTSFNAAFSFVFDDGAPHTISSDVLITFNNQIYGFLTTAFIPFEASILLNGQHLPDLEPGFFGAVGSISSLDFRPQDFISFEDTFNVVSFLDIVVATIDEPSTFASLVAGLCLLALASSRFRRRGGQPPEISRHSGERYI